MNDMQLTILREFVKYELEHFEEVVDNTSDDDWAKRNSRFDVERAKETLEKIQEKLKTLD